MRFTLRGHGQPFSRVAASWSIQHLNVHGFIPYQVQRSLLQQRQQASKSFVGNQLTVFTALAVGTAILLLVVLILCIARRRRTLSRGAARPLRGAVWRTPIIGVANPPAMLIMVIHPGYEVMCAQKVDVAKPLQDSAPRLDKCGSTFEDGIPRSSIPRNGMLGSSDVQLVSLSPGEMQLRAGSPQPASPAPARRARGNGVLGTVRRLRMRFSSAPSASGTVTNSLSVPTAATPYAVAQTIDTAPAIESLGERRPLSAHTLVPNGRGDPLVNTEAVSDNAATSSRGPPLDSRETYNEHSGASVAHAMPAGSRLAAAVSDQSTTPSLTAAADRHGAAIGGSGGGGLQQATPLSQSGGLGLPAGNHVTEDTVAGASQVLVELYPPYLQWDYQTAAAAIEPYSEMEVPLVAAASPRGLSPLMFPRPGTTAVVGQRRRAFRNYNGAWLDANVRNYSSDTRHARRSANRTFLDV